MAEPKAIIFREKELIQEGKRTDGSVWQKYKYLGDDGEEYTMFGEYELEKTYRIVMKETEKNGKTYKNWIIVPDAAARGAAVARIIEKLDTMGKELDEVHEMTEKIVDLLSPKS